MVKMVRHGEEYLAYKALVGLEVAEQEEAS